MWEEETVDERIGTMLYFIKHPKYVVKRHLNQIKKRYMVNVDQRKEESMTIIYDMFDVSLPKSYASQYNIKVPNHKKIATFFFCGFMSGWVYSTSY